MTMAHEKGSLDARLVALSDNTEEVERKGAWLAEEIKKFKKEHNVQEDSPPSDELIKLQISLPEWRPESPVFEEPILNWAEVEAAESGKVPNWNREFLPEEEILEPPPQMQVSRVEQSTGYCLTNKCGSQWVRETCPVEPKTIDKQEIYQFIINNNYDDEKVTVYDSGCVIKSVCFRKVFSICDNC